MSNKKNKPQDNSHSDNIPDFTVERLGSSNYDTPLIKHFNHEQTVEGFMDDSARIVYNPRVRSVKKFMEAGEDPPSIEVAGPRKKIFFDTANVRAAIVTCGGLCPGLNDVIRSLFMELHYRYRVKEVLGVRFGYSGLCPRVGQPPIELTPELVANIHRDGGTLLGSSRGPQDPAEMVDFLERMRINVLFSIGGDGTQRGALDLANEIERRKLKIGVIGIPKTIDNDISYVERSFGFNTAVSIARDVLSAGHEEARGAYNGVAVVKLMGRNSGFIAAMAAVANGDANFVLIPEVPFDLEGDKGFFRALEKRLENRRHALVVVAEGAGQDILEKEDLRRKFDASGNVKLGDIGVYLRDKIAAHFSSGWHAATVKYIDPSYIIRSSPANADDSIFCSQLARHAVHAAMTGRTKMVVGIWNNTFTYVPMNLVISKRKQIDPYGSEWLSVLETTGQPAVMKNEL
ncbi:MAG: ATP-dependent 6-phosphofructokinase [Candidatus Latescibacteria bacterium]|nr:ATP-dependent 6-phosphofructokinase [Candidatus Latescibacterota bacterium]